MGLLQGSECCTSSGLQDITQQLVPGLPHVGVPMPWVKAAASALPCCCPVSWGQGGQQQGGCSGDLRPGFTLTSLPAMGEQN